MTKDDTNNYSLYSSRKPEDELLLELDKVTNGSQINEDLKYYLKELTDLKFALDESTIVAITDNKGIIKYVNEKFCQISKYSREELIGQDHRIINSGHHEKEFFKNLWETISSGKVWHGEIKNKAKDGSYYWVNTTIVPFLDRQNGTPYQYLAIRNEVTELKSAQEELKVMMNNVLNIQEEERKRFSRELHDGIGQSLFSILIQLDQKISESDMTSLENLRNEVALIIQDVRTLAWELRPSLLDDLGVLPALRKYIEMFSQHYGVRTHLSSNLKGRLNVQEETNIYRIVQEALTNIGKYANVDEAFITITDNSDTVEVTIEDKGIGFMQTTKGNGVGLFSMEERAHSMDGTLIIKSEQGQGTTIMLTFPKKNS